MAWVTKDGETILVDDGAVQYWLDQGWAPDSDRDGVDDADEGGGVQGPAAWFTMTGSIADATPPVRTPVTFTVIDDGRAPETGLVTIDSEDSTTLIAQESGEYLFFVTVGAATNQAADTAGLAHLLANVAINGDNEAPAYYFENGNFFWVADDVTQQPMQSAFTFHQTLEVGDTIQVKIRVGVQTAVLAGSTEWLVVGSAIGITKLATV